MKKLSVVAIVSSVLFLSFFAVACGSTPEPEVEEETIGEVEEEESEVVAERPTIPGSLQGTWYDKKYDCNWTLEVNGSSDAITLRDASSDALIYKFTRDNTQNFNLSANSDGVTVQFDCAAKNRNYKFKKEATSLSKDLDMDIYNSKYKTRHQTVIVYKGYKAE